MYLTRIAGIETPDLRRRDPLHAMYLTRIAGIETHRRELLTRDRQMMYLTRIAGIETDRQEYVVKAVERCILPA